jgi:hypothetical protein
MSLSEHAKPDFNPYRPERFYSNFTPLESEGANPVYPNCPAIMSDGRHITYYNSTNELTRRIQELNNIKSSNAFREYLQSNAENIMNNERKYIEHRFSCVPNIACSEGYYYVNTRYDN